MNLDVSKNIYDLCKLHNLEIHVKNITSGSVINFENEQLLIINEFLESGLTINLPANTCAIGHQLFISLNLQIENEKKNLFTSTAKIINIEEVETNINLITVKFVQYDVTTWNHFLTMFQTQQENIQSLLEVLKDFKK